MYCISTGHPLAKYTFEVCRQNCPGERFGRRSAEELCKLPKLHVRVVSAWVQPDVRRLELLMQNRNEREAEWRVMLDSELRWRKSLGSRTWLLGPALMNLKLSGYPWKPSPYLSFPVRYKKYANANSSPKLKVDNLCTYINLKAYKIALSLSSTSCDWLNLKRLVAQ